MKEDIFRAILEMRITSAISELSMGFVLGTLTSALAIVVVITVIVLIAIFILRKRMRRKEGMGHQRHQMSDSKKSPKEDRLESVRTETQAIPGPSQSDADFDLEGYSNSSSSSDHSSNWESDHWSKESEEKDDLLPSLSLGSRIHPHMSPSMASPHFGQSNHIPIVSKSQPLPHDGLFIRRNNAFGTKSVLSIKDLIEQGVIIDQTNIRFDDFVASSSEQVPSPSQGQAVDVSHGVAAIQPNYRYHERTTHYLEIALKASDSPGETSAKNGRTPVNYVFVVDISGSMTGEKLDTVKTAIREIYQKMLDSDIIGLVVFDHQVQTLLKAIPKGQIDPDKFSQIVSGLKTGGSTDINLGLSYGIDELSRHGKPGLVNYLYLFSDGNPNSGETDWIKIRQNVVNKARGNLSLSVFGFGSDANMRELDALAGLTGGRSTFVTHASDVRLSLQEDLNRREHLVALNIQMKIEIDPDVAILHLFGHDLITDAANRAAVLRDIEAARSKAHELTGIESQPDIVTEDKGIRIFAPDLAVGETYWVVFELSIPKERKLPNLGKASVQYVDALARQNAKHDLSLSLTGTIPPDVVTLHGVGMWTSEVTFYALDDLYQNDYETAKSRIAKHIQVLESARAFVPSPQITDDIITLKKFVSLTANLGKPISFSDSSFGGAGAYAIYTLNSFGQVRNGFMRANYY